MIVSGGKADATAPPSLATVGILPVPKNSAVPELPAVKAIADVERLEADVNLTSPFTIPTLTFFSNKLPDV